MCDNVMCDNNICDSVMCDIMCDNIMCDNIVCDSVMCDNNICDSVMCNKVMCDSVMCDKVMCDSVVCVHCTICFYLSLFCLQWQDNIVKKTTMLHLKKLCPFFGFQQGLHADVNSANATVVCTCDFHVMRM